MKVEYFADTDTLYIEFRDEGIVDTKDLDEETLVEYDAAGRICAITLEHASERTDLQDVTMHGLAA